MERYENKQTLSYYDLSLSVVSSRLKTYLSQALLSLTASTFVITEKRLCYFGHINGLLTFYVLCTVN